MDNTIAIIATCDTKGEEAQYLKDKVESCGIKGLVIDVGILGNPVKVIPDVTKHQVAQAAGTTIQELIARGSRGAAVEGMIEGIYTTVKSLYSEGKIHGMIAIGGAEGSVIARAAMNALPLGVPKLTVSPIASGSHKFKEIIGYNDAMVMHSVIDILGINSISKTIFDNAVGAVVGMVNVKKQSQNAAKRVAISMLGTVTKPIMNVIKPKLESMGYEVFTFHANGTGGDCMDNLVREGYFDGVLDYAVNEMVGINFGGFHKSKDERMEAALELGVPTVIVPGVSDIFVTSTEDGMSPRFDGMKKYKHNPEITLVALSVEQIKVVAETLIKKLNRSKKSIKVLFPKKGLCSQNKEGLALWNPEGTATLLAELKSKLRKDIEIIEMDAHINDDEFANKAFEYLIESIEGQQVN